MRNRLSNSFAILLRMAFAWLMAISMAACSPTTPDPKPPLYTPIGLSRIGSTAEMEFWAYPNDSHEKNVLMVGLRFKRDWSAPNQKIDYTYLARIDAAKIRVNITATKNGNPVEFRSYSEFDSMVQIRPIARFGNAEAKARSWGHDGEYDYFYLADIARKEGGLYKVNVEVVEPNLDMAGLQAEVFVAFRMFGGK